MKEFRNLENSTRVGNRNQGIKFHQPYQSSRNKGYKSGHITCFWVAIFHILSRMHHQADWSSAAKSALICDCDRLSQVLNFLGIFLLQNNKCLSALLAVMEVSRPGGVFHKDACTSSSYVQFSRTNVTCDARRNTVLQCKASRAYCNPKQCNSS